VCKCVVVCSGAVRVVCKCVFVCSGAVRVVCKCVFVCSGAVRVVCKCVFDKQTSKERWGSGAAEVTEAQISERQVALHNGHVQSSINVSEHL